MIVAGIDVGAKATKAVLLGGGRVLSSSHTLTGFDQKSSASRVLDEASKAAGISVSRVERIVSTGVGKKAASSASKYVTEVTADARGALHLFPTTRTILDVGAEEARAIRCDKTGAVVDFAMNEKCAAGVGAFLESMARALEVTVEEMSRLSLRSDKTIQLNAQCAIFAESEVVTLMHAKAKKEDIARAIHDAIASRIGCLASTLGVEGPIVLIGGLGQNAGLVDSLKRNMGVELLVPEAPQFVGALGAGLIALDKPGAK